jgi:hypothetical protein
MNITTTVRTCLVASAIAVAGFATTACGEEVQPPSQDIGVQLPEPEVKHYEPACNTRAALEPCPSDTPTGTDWSKRKQLDDEFRPGL